MKNSVFIFLVFLLMLSEVHAQEMRSFSAGLIVSSSLCVASNVNLNGPETSLLGFICSSKNEFSLGVNVYPNSIFGFDGGYRRLFLKDEKKSCWYAEYNLRYVKYASGYAEPGSIDYLNGSVAREEDMIHSNDLVINNFSFGREFNISNVFHFNISLGGGLAWRQEKFLNYWQSVYGNETDNSITASILFKLELGINLYRNN